MHHLDFWLFILAITGLFLGGWSICWARTHPERGRGWWGRRLFVANLILLGISGLVAAGIRADSLVPLGLLAGFLLIGMLWEAPSRAWDKRPFPAEDALGQ